MMQWYNPMAGGPPRPRVILTILEQPLPDVELIKGKKDKKGELTKAINEKYGVLSNTLHQKAKDAERTLSSVAKALSNVTLTAKNIKPNTPDAGCFILALPTEILLDVFEYLDFTDQSVLRFSCRALLHILPDPVTQRRSLNLGASPCDNRNLMFRMLNSSLLPVVKSPLDGHKLSRVEIADQLRLASHCGLCNAVFAGETLVRCPFHKFVQPKRTMKEKMRRNIRRVSSVRYLWDYFRRYDYGIFVKRRGTSTLKSYREFTHRRASTLTPQHVTSMDYAFVPSWNHMVKQIEEERIAAGLLERVSVTFGGSNAPSSTAYPNSAQPSNSTYRMAADETTDGDNDHNIFKLFCCNHCQYVLPGNSYENQCENCACNSCGWSTVEIMRVVVVNEQEVRFVPLGYVRETKPGILGKIKKKITSPK